MGHVLQTISLHGFIFQCPYHLQQLTTNIILIVLDNMDTERLILIFRSCERNLETSNIDQCLTVGGGDVTAEVVEAESVRATEMGLDDSTIELSDDEADDDTHPTHNTNTELHFSPQYCHMGISKHQIIVIIISMM